MHKKGSTNMASLKRARIPLVVLVSLAVLFLTNVGTASHTAYAAAAPHFTGSTFTVDGKVYHLTKGVALKVPVNWLHGKIRYVSAKFDDITYDITSSTAGNATPGLSRQVHQMGAAIPLAYYCQTSTITLNDYDFLGIIIASYTLLEYWCHDQSLDGGTLGEFDNPYEQSYGNAGWGLVNHAEGVQYKDDFDGYSNGIFRFNGPLGIGCVSGYANIHVQGDGHWNANAANASEFGC